MLLLNLLPRQCAPMGEYLVFTLCAGMAAMGEFAGHERRSTLTWPGRSAILGLLAAALGIRRDDDLEFAKLEALQIAVGVVDDGLPLRDFHTVQTVPTPQVKCPDSRPAALLAAGRDGAYTHITLRDYRVGVLYTVALWGDSLDRFVEALTHPIFTLYLGRKSCPLSAPPMPKIITSGDPVTALRQACIPPFYTSPDLKLVMSDQRLSVNDVEEKRNDVAIDRVKWHFTSRCVYRHNPVLQEKMA